MRDWKRTTQYDLVCPPCTIALRFVDGCSLFIVSKQGEDIGFYDELSDAMARARLEEKNELAGAM